MVMLRTASGALPALYFGRLSVGLRIRHAERYRAERYRAERYRAENRSAKRPVGRPFGRRLTGQVGTHRWVVL